MYKERKDRTEYVLNDEAAKDERHQELEKLLMDEVRPCGNTIGEACANRAFVDTMLGSLLALCVIGFVIYASRTFSGEDSSFGVYNALNAVSLVLFGVNSNQAIKVSVMAIGVLCFAAPIAFALQKIERGILGLKYDPQAELDYTAAMIASSAYRAERGVKQQLVRLMSRPTLRARAAGGMQRFALEEQCHKVNPTEPGALVDAATIYLEYGPDEVEQAESALKLHVEERACALLHVRQQGVLVTAKILFAPEDEYAEKLVPAMNASGSNLWSGFWYIMKVIFSGGMYLLWERTQPQQPPTGRGASAPPSTGGSAAPWSASTPSARSATAPANVGGQTNE